MTGYSRDSVTFGNELKQIGITADREKLRKLVFDFASKSRCTEESSGFDYCSNCQTEPDLEHFTSHAKGCSVIYAEQLLMEIDHD